VDLMEKKYGVVAILDALGASEFDDQKIQEFLSMRKELCELIAGQGQELTQLAETDVSATTFTFGDTAIILVEVPESSNTNLTIFSALILFQNYMFHAMEKGIFFRGAFSIGDYIADSESNTVMGEAITDAASWYEKADWFGLIGTPHTIDVLEHEINKELLDDPMYMTLYPVPIKGGEVVELYTVSWPGRFHQGPKSFEPSEYFTRLLSRQRIPFGTQGKYANSRRYFREVTRRISALKASEQDGK